MAMPPFLSPLDDFVRRHQMPTLVVGGSAWKLWAQNVFV